MLIWLHHEPSDFVHGLNSNITPWLYRDMICKSRETEKCFNIASSGVSSGLLNESTQLKKSFGKSWWAQDERGGWNREVNLPSPYFLSYSVPPPSWNHHPALLKDTWEYETQGIRMEFLVLSFLTMTLLQNKNRLLPNCFTARLYISYIHGEVYCVFTTVR